MLLRVTPVDQFRQGVRLDREILHRKLLLPRPPHHGLPYIGFAAVIQELSSWVSKK